MGTDLVSVVCCFLIGYWLVSLVIAKWKEFSGSPSENDPQGSIGTGRSEQTFRVSNSTVGAESERHEARYRHVLGLTDQAKEREIEVAYRTLLTKNHPDKVTHLDEEFQQLASRRTKELTEAYEYFKIKYRFR